MASLLNSATSDAVASGSNEGYLQKKEDGEILVVIASCDRNVLV